MQWDDAPCRSWVESPAYGALLAAGAAEALLLVSEAFDAEESETAGAVDPNAEPEEQIPDRPVSAARPVPVPPRAPLVAAKNRHAESTPRGRWRFTNLARGQVAALGRSESDIVEILESPHVEAQAPSGTATNHFGDDLLIMVDEGGEVIISVIERQMHAPSGATYSTSTNSPTPKAGPPARQKTHSGGSGRRMPSNVKEFLAMLKEHGFDTERGGKGHELATHPAHPDVRVAVPSTPSDRRSYPNLIADIKRRTGIDITKKEG